MSDVIKAAIGELRDCLTKVELAAAALERLEGLAAPVAAALQQKRTQRRPEKKQGRPNYPTVLPTAACHSPGDRILVFVNKAHKPVTMTDVCKGLGLKSGTAYCALERLVREKRLAKKGREYSPIAAKEDGARFSPVVASAG